MTKSIVVDEVNSTDNELHFKMTMAGQVAEPPHPLSLRIIKKDQNGNTVPSMQFQIYPVASRSPASEVDPPRGNPPTPPQR